MQQQPLRMCVLSLTTNVVSLLWYDNTMSHNHVIEACNCKEYMYLYL